MYTSLKFSKQLKEAGCELESKMFWQKWTQDEWKLNHYSDFNGIDKKTGQIVVDGYGVIKSVVEDTDDACYSYDILNDICIKYAKEFFGETFCKLNVDDLTTKKRHKFNKYYVYYSFIILSMLQQNKTQEEIEKYIWDNCKFNKQDKNPLRSNEIL